MVVNRAWYRLTMVQLMVSQTRMVINLLLTMGISLDHLLTDRELGTAMVHTRDGASARNLMGRMQQVEQRFRHIWSWEEGDGGTATPSTARGSRDLPTSSTTRVAPPTRVSPVSAQRASKAAPISPPSTTRRQMVELNQPEDEPVGQEIMELQCNCGLPAVIYTCRKQGVNYGRNFLRCPMVMIGDKCDFFMWINTEGEIQRPGCTHQRISRQGSNAFIEQKICRDCGKMIERARKDPADAARHPR
jgi:hypothetical protein